MNVKEKLEKARELVPSEAPSQTRPGLRLGLIALSAAWLSGCATPALWKHTAAHNWEALPSTTQFFAATNAGQQNVIVVFQQSFSRKDESKFREVAWNVCRPPTELAIGRRAVRQLTNACEHIEPMPCFPQNEAPADATSAPPGYAMRGDLADEFTLHLEGMPPGPFELPSTTQERRWLRRLAILPFAVTVDTVIVLACFSGGPVPMR